MEHDSVNQTGAGDGIWPGHSGAALRRFKYWQDGLFLVSCGLYAINRWGIKPHCRLTFFHDYFNDLLLMPCALPLMLWVQQWLGLRPKDQRPTWKEIGFHLAVWSVLFEVLGPRLFPWTTGDPWDVVAYSVGAVGAGLWWRRRYEL